MGLSARYLPNATPLDPADDPPSSIDPLGLLGPAERIAEVLFPGFTARMWRPRFLTFAALAAVIAERAKASQVDGDDGGLSARLAFERLFVSAVVRQFEQDGQAWKRAAIRLPGRLLAQRALRSEDTPLGRNNFLKGQAINGPFGVLARLARSLDIVNEDDGLGRGGEDLLMEWSRDEQLPGVLDEEDSGAAGSQWVKRFTGATQDHLLNQEWRRAGWSGWWELAQTLRPDKVGRRERQALRRLLDGDRIRRRCLELLCQSESVAVYRKASEGGRGEQDRRVLLDAMLPALTPSEGEEDRVIELAIHLADAYEHVACHLETAFRCLLWGLTRRVGQAKPSEIEADPQLQPVFQSLCRQLPKASTRLRDLIEMIPTFPQIADRNPLEPLNVITSHAATGSENPKRLIEVVMRRHREVQASKGKGMWIEPGERWVLMPGRGDANTRAPRARVQYLHTFRIPNAYSFLAELGLPGVEVPDGEA